MTRGNTSVQITVDTDLAIFAKNQLTKTLIKSASKPRPKLKMAKGDIVPVVVVSGYEWETQIDIYEYDSYGIATILASDASDGGKVGIYARKASYPIRTISDFTEISWLELNQAKAKGIDISGRYADALQLGIDKKLNDLGYNGDLAYGLQGIFTSQLSRANFATTMANASTPDVLLTMMSNAASLPLLNSNTVWSPKIAVMPEAQAQILGNTMRASGSDKTVYQQFLDNQEALDQIDTIIVDNTLKGKGENGTDAMLILPYDRLPESYEDVSSDIQDGIDLNFPIYLLIAQEMMIPSEFEQWHDQMFKQRAIMRTGGLIVTDPTAGVIVSNI